MTTDDLHDHDLEARLRAVLADRAGAISGPPPALPIVRAAAIGAGHSSRHRPPRWVAAAAAVLVAGGAVVVARDHRDPAQLVRSGDPARPERRAVPELPAGVDLGLATPLATADGAARDVARAYLAERFAYRGDIEVEPGEDLPGHLTGTPPQPELVAQLERQLTIASAAGPAAGVTALTFQLPVEGADHPVAGRIYLRPADDAWDVVAVVTDGLTVAAARTDGRLRSRAAGDPLDPNLASGVSLSTRRMDATLVGVGRGDGSGIKSDTPVDEVPLVVTARAMQDRTLALTEFVSDPPTRSAAIWSGSSNDAVRRRDPVTAARQFARSTAQPLGVTASEEFTPSSGPAQAGVRLTLGSGLLVDLALARTSTGWVVLGVHDDTGLSGSEESALVGEGRDQMRSFRFQLPATTAEAVFTYVSAGQWASMPVDDLETARSEAGVKIRADVEVTATLLVGRDASGAVVTVQGRSWA